MEGMADIVRPTRLTHDQVAVVLRRAAELEALSDAPGEGDGYDSRPGGEGARAAGRAAGPRHRAPPAAHRARSTATTPGRWRRPPARWPCPPPRCARRWPS